MFPIDLARDRRGGGEDLFCPACQHGNHFLRGGMLWCGDGKLRLIGWKCLENFVGTTRYQEIERKHKRQLLLKAAEEFLYNHLGKIGQVFDRIRSAEKGSQEVQRIRAGLTQSLNPREFAGFDRLLRKDDGALKQPERHRRPDGGFETNFVEVGRIPVGRLFDRDFQPMAESREIRVAIEGALNRDLVEAAQSPAKDDIDDLAIAYLQDVSGDAAIEAHKALESSFQRLTRLEVQLAAALRFSTAKTILTLRACRRVPLLKSLDIRLDQSKGFILAGEGMQSLFIRWPGSDRR